MNKKSIYLLLVLCCSGVYASAQGYWNNHTGIDIGGSILQFDKKPAALPAGSTSSPGLMGSIFFDFVRVKETASRDIPIWGIKFKLNLQTVGYKDPAGSFAYANYFTVPLLFKVRLGGTESYYTIYNNHNGTYSPQYHHQNKFSVYLYAGPQYEYVYSQSAAYGYTFSNKALVGYIYGNIAGVAGLEFNFETVLLDFSWQQAFQPVYLNSVPLKSSGLAFRIGFPFRNIYRNW